MAKPWSEVEQSPAYQQMQPEAQLAAKQQYFDSVVSPKPEYQSLAPDQQQAAKTQFIGTAPSTTPESAPDSVATKGFNYFTEHPFKTMFEPAAKTLTGKSLEDRAMDTVSTDNVVPTPSNRPYDTNLPLVKPKVFTDKMIAGEVGGVADAITTPGSYIPIPGAKAIGEIPVGATTVGRIAKNVAVDKTFPQGVKDLQAMEDRLGNVSTSASGKGVDTSSRGVQIGQSASPAVNDAVLKSYNAIVQPSTGKINSPAKFNAQNTKNVDAMKAIHDWSDITGSNLTNKTAGVVPTATRQDLLDAVQKTKQAIWDNIDAKAKNASMAGATVDLGDVANAVVKPLMNDSSIARQRPDLIPFLQKTFDSYSKSGKIGIDEAQNDLKILNDDIGKYLRSSNPNDASVGAVKLAISQAMRGQMDSAIEQHLGESGYQYLRNQYGALSSVEGDITKAAARQAKGSGGVTHPILDVMSGVDLGKALLSAVSGNPVGAVKDVGLAGVYQGVKGSLDWIKSPDKKIADMFNLIDRHYGKNPINVENTDYSNPAVKTLGNHADSIPDNPVLRDNTKKARTLDQTNPSAPNFGSYQNFDKSASSDALESLIKAHREVNQGGATQQDVQNAIDMANHFKQNKISTIGPNIKKFNDIDSLTQFVGDNEKNIDLISTDANGNFYAHLKGNKK